MANAGRSHVARRGEHAGGRIVEFCARKDAPIGALPPSEQDLPTGSKVAVYKDRDLIMLPVAVNVPAVWPRASGSPAVSQRRSVRIRAV